MACRRDSTKCRKSCHSMVLCLSSNFFSEFLGCDELNKIVKVFASIVFQVMVKYFFQGLYSTFSRCCHSPTPCRVNLFSLTIAKLYKVTSEFCSCVNRKVLGLSFFCISIQKCTNRLFGIFCFPSFCIYGSIKQVLTNYQILYAVPIVG